MEFIKGDTVEIFVEPRDTGIVIEDRGSQVLIHYPDGIRQFIGKNAIKNKSI